MSATKLNALEGIRASLTLSGENPIVRVLRKESNTPETFEGVSIVLQLRSFETRDAPERVGFIDSIIWTKAADFKPSSLIIRNGSKETRVESVVRLEIVKGVVEEISST
ncbi:MAG: hypothetical protein KGH94_02480 [Candidatus Micrarchaeota archaeon]|nr:hypothetical protein [Candidatus Micrarchaeota archaeon]